MRGPADAGGDGEDVGVENNIVRVEVEFGHEQVVAAFADILASLQRVGLSVSGAKIKFKFNI